MAREGGVEKYDANTEAFQMRAQWKKAEICRKMWHEQWNWLLDERELAANEANVIRQKHANALPKQKQKFVSTKSLKPVPVTSTGFVGWIASKPDCKLEIYTSWISKPPIRLPDAWQSPDYYGPEKK